MHLQIFFVITLRMVTGGNYYPAFWGSTFADSFTQVQVCDASKAESLAIAGLIKKIP